MTPRIQKIGSIDEGIDGSDEYILLSETGDASFDEVYDWLLKWVWCDSAYPGAYFCKSIQLVKQQYEDTYIGTIHHRYDI